ncbi:Kinase, NEK [Giardia muris]|uniref:Kinase, NEK n=1 Tax=Giardia muris TaxID=5742 RepID=A0A4Z1SST4_GIAMU|nr:Kinase, NEK [Giardia muris]|eukprot:TNJ28924.1 Kinase, NEK [Giardia muris]
MENAFDCPDLEAARGITIYREGPLQLRVLLRGRHKRDLAAHYMRLSNTLAYIEHPNVMPVDVVCTDSPTGFLLIGRGDFEPLIKEEEDRPEPNQLATICWRVMACFCSLFGSIARPFRRGNVLTILPMYDINAEDLFICATTGHVMVLPRIPLYAENTEAMRRTYANRRETAAPEVLQGGEWDRASVAWSLGCVLYRLCYGRYPFPQEAQLAAIATGALRLPMLQGPLSIIRDLIGQLLVREPASRLRFADLVTRPEVLVHLRRIPLPQFVSYSSYYKQLFGVQRTYWDLAQAYQNTVEKSRMVEERSELVEELKFIVRDLPGFVPLECLGRNELFTTYIIQCPETELRALCRVYALTCTTATNYLARYLKLKTRRYHTLLPKVLLGKVSPSDRYAYELVEDETMIPLWSHLSPEGVGIDEEWLWRLISETLDLLHTLSFEGGDEIRTLFGQYFTIKKEAYYIASDYTLRLLEFNGTSQLLKIHRSQYSASQPSEYRVHNSLNELGHVVYELCRGEELSQKELEQIVSSTPVEPVGNQLYSSLATSLSRSISLEQPGVAEQFLGQAYTTDLHHLVHLLLSAQRENEGIIDVILRTPQVYNRIRPETRFRLDGLNPLQLSILQNDENAFLSNLEGHLAKKDRLGRTALFIAAQYGRYQFINSISDYEGEYVDTQGRTAMMAAVANGHFECLELLLKFCLRRQDMLGNTALMYAIIYGRQGMIELLKPEVKQCTRKGQTALMLGAFLGYSEGVGKLLFYEACFASRSGWTALMYAAVANNVSGIKDLRVEEARLQNRKGQTALMIAALKGHQEAVDALLRFEAGMRDQDGHTAFFLASAKGHTACAGALQPFEQPHTILS